MRLSLGKKVAFTTYALLWSAQFYFESQDKGLGHGVLTGIKRACIGTVVFAVVYVSDIVSWFKNRNVDPKRDDNLSDIQIQQEETKVLDSLRNRAAILENLNANGINREEEKNKIDADTSPLILSNEARTNEARANEVRGLQNPVTSGLTSGLTSEGLHPGKDGFKIKR